MEKSKVKKRLIVIGAGPAGLSAATNLIELSDDWNIVILEASDAIGGLSRTVRHNGCRIDIGGHRFFSKSKEVNDFWKKLMPLQGHPSWDDRVLGRIGNVEAGGPDPEQEDCVLLKRRRISRIYYLRRFFDYPISLSLSTFWGMGILRTIKAGASYLHSVFHKRQENSLEDFYINRFGKVLYSMFFEDYTKKLWGIHPSRISPEWGAQRIKGLSLWKALLNIFTPKNAKKETSLIEEFIYPKFGPGQLWETLADKIRNRGVEIQLQSKIQKIICSGGRISKVVLENEETIDCDAVFSSMPIKDLITALSEAPADVRRIAKELPYRDFITIGIKVERLAIENRTRAPTINRLIPDTWIYVQDRKVDLGRIQIFNNWSPYMVDDPNRHVWIGLEYFCSEGDCLWNLNDASFIQKAVNELKEIGLIRNDTQILDSVCIRVKKAYPAYFGSYANFATLQHYIDKFNNLYCIGRNGQHRYNNMDHSMLCGFAAARALALGEDKTCVWNVNTEKSYQESN